MLLKQAQIITAWNSVETHCLHKDMLVQRQSRKKKHKAGELGRVVIVNIKLTSLKFVFLFIYQQICFQTFLIVAT